LIIDVGGFCNLFEWCDAGACECSSSSPPDSSSGSTAPVFFRLVSRFLELLDIVMLLADRLHRGQRSDGLGRISKVRRMALREDRAPADPFHGSWWGMVNCRPRCPR